MTLLYMINYMNLHAYDSESVYHVRTETKIKSQVDTYMDQKKKTRKSGDKIVTSLNSSTIILSHVFLPSPTSDATRVFTL